MEEGNVPIDELLDVEILAEVKARASRDNNFRLSIIAEFNDDADPDFEESIIRELGNNYIIFDSPYAESIVEKIQAFCDKYGEFEFDMVLDKISKPVKIG